MNRLHLRPIRPCRAAEARGLTKYKRREGKFTQSLDLITDLLVVKSVRIDRYRVCCAETPQTLSHQTLIKPAGT